ncbi:MAG: hypothetical protein ABI402_11600 [Ferruginibacter sp.]
MELDDLKNDWEAVSNQTSKQNKLTHKIIDQMTQQKYDSKINKIKYPEWVGAIVCVLNVFYIAFNFSKLDTLPFQIIGVSTSILLLVMAAIGLMSFNRLSLQGDLNRPYAETIRQFAIQKLRFQKFQRVNAFLGYLLLVGVVMLLPKLFYKKDVTDSKYFLIFAMSLGYIFLVFFSKWIYKFYKRSINQAEELLKEAES